MQMNVLNMKVPVVNIKRATRISGKYLMELQAVYLCNLFLMISANVQEGGEF